MPWPWSRAGGGTTAEGQGVPWGSARALRGGGTPEVRGFASVASPSRHAFTGGVRRCVPNGLRLRFEAQPIPDGQEHVQERVRLLPELAGGILEAVLGRTKGVDRDGLAVFAL